MNDADAVFGAVILELKAVEDPMQRQGLPPREPDYRLRLALKVLLRVYGLRCVSVRDKNSGDVIDQQPQTEETNATQKKHSE